MKSSRPSQRAQPAGSTRGGEASEAGGCPLPFAEPTEPGRPGLPRRHWLALVLASAALHYLSLLVSVRTGNLEPDPNHDHVHVMRQVLAEGFPRAAVWPRATATTWPSSGA